MSSAEEPLQLDLRLHDLSKIDRNQARLSPSSTVSPYHNLTTQTSPSLSKDELQLQQQQQQMKLPLKLPQRRKFITLADANSASFGLSFHVNLDNFASSENSAFQKTLDLAMAEGQEEASKQVELPAMSVNKEGAFYEAVEMKNAKKKILAQLAETPGGTVDSQKIESSFHRSSIPSRTCRFCGREFPSGRALGGHMRVHGALLFSDTSLQKIVEQEPSGSQGELETLGSERQLDPHLPRRKSQIEETKPSSFTSSSSSSQLNSEKLNLTIKLDRHGQEDEEEDEESEKGKQEKVTRMVNLNSFQCTSPMMSCKPSKLLGDASSELLTGKRKPASALYELRRNPKPNQRFFRDQEQRSLLNGFWPTASAAGSVPRSRSPSPDRERACSECGKVFLSWKALFGHMRCHPERDWRGIQRPGRSSEVDRPFRSSTPKASNAEISSAETIGNCELACSVSSHVVNAEKCKVNSQQDPSLKNASTVATEAPKESMHPLAQKAGICAQIDRHQFRDAATKIESGEDSIKEGPTFKKSAITSKKDHRTKRAAEHADHRATAIEGSKLAWCPSWCTGKRSKRHRSGHSSLYEPILTSETTSIELMRFSQQDARPDMQEDLDMANCLVLLSNARDNLRDIERPGMQRRDLKEPAVSHHMTKQQVSSKGIYSQSVSMAGRGAFQAHVQVNEHLYGNTDDDADAFDDEVDTKAATFPVGVEEENHESFNTDVKYQCSTCKKCFNSHQALGGHRASHKKMKGCFAQTKSVGKQAQESDEANGVYDEFSIEPIRSPSAGTQSRERQQEEETPDACVDLSIKVSPKKKMKGHQCSICHRVFASGQALGGHKRCHWNGERYVADAMSVASSSNSKQPSMEEGSDLVSKSSGIKQVAKEDALDLNLPAPLDDEEDTFDSVPSPCAAGGLLSKAAKEEQAVSSLIHSAGNIGKQSNAHNDRMVKDIFGSVPGRSFLLEDREFGESRCRFDRRPPLWNQKWDNMVSAQIPQVCSWSKTS